MKPAHQRKKIYRETPIKLENIPKSKLHSVAKVIVQFPAGCVRFQDVRTIKIIKAENPSAMLIVSSDGSTRKKDKRKDWYYVS